MKKGFTLIETSILIGISTLALLALVNLFFIFNSMYGYQQAFMAAAGSAGAGMNALEEAVLPANQVLASHSFNGTMYSSGATTLVLELPAVDTSGNILQGTKDYVVFYTSSGTLYRLILAGASSVRVSGLTKLSTALDAISFTYDNADFTKVTGVTADIQTRSQFKQQTVQGHLQEKLYLRNNI